MLADPDLSVLSSAEKDALIRRLLSHLHDLTKRVTALEAENAALRDRLNLPPKTPRNSSTPPSQGHKPNGEPTNRRKGKGHPGVARDLHPNPTRHRDVVATQCPHCRTDVSDVVQVVMQSYDRIELPEIRPDVTRVTLRGGVCPCCTRRFKAEPPNGLEPGSPFGPNLRAFVLYLRYTQAISFERLARLMSDLLGLRISEGALNNMLDASRTAFAWQASLIRQHLLCGTALQSDETSMRVGKRTWWNWVFHHGESACFVIRPSRGSAVVEDFLGEVRPDYWVSDRYGAQMGWAVKDHQLCLAHLLRRCRGLLLDYPQHPCVRAVKAVLQAALATRDAHHAGTVSAHGLAVARGQYLARLGALLARRPSPHRRIALLQQHLDTEFASIFSFLFDPRLDATNWRAEHALRTAVITRKTCGGGNRTAHGAASQQILTSVLRTADQRGLDATDVLVTLLTASTPTVPPELYTAAALH